MFPNKTNRDLTKGESENNTAEKKYEGHSWGVTKIATHIEKSS